MRGDEPGPSQTPGGGCRVPHMRGDEPEDYFDFETFYKCSPHAWG